jgi:hypothetical protein
MGALMAKIDEKVMVNAEKVLNGSWFNSKL